VLWENLHTSYPSRARESVDLNLAAACKVLGVVDELLMNPVLMIPLILSMVALTDSRKGDPRMMEVC
jgi:hypothetical protein